MAARWITAVVLLAGLACIAAELGTATSVTEHPGIVQVESLVLVMWLQQCAGSVLTSYHILSTASCFPENQSLSTKRIRAGADERGTGGVVREVYTVFRHPSYGVLGKDGDICIARLVSGLVFDNTIMQTPILGEGIYLPDGLRLQLVGWGTTAEGGEVNSDGLFSLDLYTINEERCIESYLLADTPETVTENMICAGLPGTNGRDWDSRDAGSPLYYSDVLVGMVSFGVSNGEDRFPLVNTAIGSYSNWIVDTASSL